MTTSTDDLRTLVTFSVNNGVLSASFAPLTITTPPMVTSFPKLTREDLLKDVDRGINRLDFELDLTQLGAKERQVAFQKMMDVFDDALLDFAFLNQSVLGKKGLTKEQMAIMQKRQFRQRINHKTGRQYPDAMVARSKGMREMPRMPVYDEHGHPYYLDVVGNDIVSVVLVYLGPYSKPNNYFGNAWQLVGVQRLGHMDRPDAAEAKTSFVAWDSSAFPAL